MKEKKICALLFLILRACSLAAQNPRNAPDIVSRAASLIDAETGTVLYEKNPDEEIPPASLTKLMTMHIVFREIASG
ncbi:MAG: D-alanyl-D-alanine carboxypeptidase, partial [Treponema sp.]|nr:D-alanyl-D-alanine carboxypeptidase [Treponema sp.]